MLKKRSNSCLVLLIHAWYLSTGMGYGMISVSGIVSLYYTVIIAWCILYLFTSFTSELPWEKCHPEWASERKYKISLFQVSQNLIFWELLCEIFLW